MKSLPFTYPIPAALQAGACAALGAAWVVEPLLAPTTGVQRLLILLAGAGLVIAGWLSLRRKQFRDNQSAQRYFDALAACEPENLQQLLLSDSLPALPENNAWSGPLQRIRECLTVQAETLTQLDQARAGAEVRLRRILSERDQFKEILVGLADPVLVMDSSGKLILANAAAERTLQVTASETEHPALEQLARCEQLISLLQETRRRKAPVQRQSELLLTDETGRQVCYRVACRPLGVKQDQSSERGGLPGVVAVFTDISSQKTIQKRNAEFVSAASHEMKTPLASIKAYVELLADGDAEDADERDEFFEVINSQTDRLQRLIENLLNIARIEAGVVKVAKTPRSLNELLQEAFNVLQPAAEQKQIQLLAEFSPLYLSVLGDRDTLLQAAINLLSNAIKYTPDGGVVRLRSRLAGQEVAFEVVDTGVGLSPEDCHKVFERFYRVAKDKEMAPGTGLGLALVKHIVEDIHGGRLEVESEPGLGSTFRVLLPKIA